MILQLTGSCRAGWLQITSRGIRIHWMFGTSVHCFRMVEALRCSNFGALLEIQISVLGVAASLYYRIDVRAP